MSWHQWKITEINTGLRLRSLGLSYGAIAVVLREYHGMDVTEVAVRGQLRSKGAVPMPRGAGVANLRRGTKRAAA